MPVLDEREAFSQRPSMADLSPSLALGVKSKKAVEAGKERANDHLVELEKLRELANNKKANQEVYRKRYATAKAAEKWETTPVFAKPNLSSLDPSVSGGGLVA